MLSFLVIVMISYARSSYAYSPPAGICSEAAHDLNLGDDSVAVVASPYLTVGQFGSEVTSKGEYEPATIDLTSTIGPTKGPSHLTPIPG